MELRRFTARKVFGYLNFDIAFQDLTFLIGVNGSGKSTALQLMEALLTPSIKELALFEFDTAELVFVDADDKCRVVSARKSDAYLTLSADWIGEDLPIADLGSEKARLLLEDQRSSEEYLRALSIRLSSHPVFKAISDLPAPVFLGIDRRHRLSSDDDGSRPDQVLYEPTRRGTHARRIFRGNLAAGLSDTQALIQEAYRSARRKLDGYQAGLRNNVLLSAFHYSDVDRDAQGRPTFSELEKSHKDLDVGAIRSDIERTLWDIGLASDDVGRRITPFFDKLSQLIEEVSQAGRESDILVEYLMNKGQLDRLQSLLAMVQEHKRRSDLVTRSLSSFVETINWFFRDSGKKVVLDAVGRLVISRGDGVHIQPDALSSGERQLLIMFAHLFFNTFGSRSQVFVIDEPELSLHLRWQDNLVEKMREAAPHMQLIIATHSPDILGGNEAFCVEVSPRA